MYKVRVKREVSQFIDSLPNSEEIKEKLIRLKHFKSTKNIHLDIKRYRDKKRDIFRLRIGKLRFIFEVEENLIFIKAADFRGRVYK